MELHCQTFFRGCTQLHRDSDRSCGSIELLRGIPWRLLAGLTQARLSGVLFAGIKQGRLRNRRIFPGVGAGLIELRPQGRHLRAGFVEIGAQGRDLLLCCGSVLLHLRTHP